MDMERYDTEAEYESKTCIKHRFFLFVFLIYSIYFSPLMRTWKHVKNNKIRNNYMVH